MAEQGHPTFSNAEKQREAFSIAVSSEEEPNNPSAKKVWYLNRHLGVYNEGRYSHVVGECARFLQTETATPQDWFKDNFRGKLGVLKCIYKCRGLSPFVRWLWLLLSYFVLPCGLGSLCLIFKRSIDTWLLCSRVALWGILGLFDGAAFTIDKKAFDALGLPGLNFLWQMRRASKSKRIDATQILDELAATQGQATASSALSQETGGGDGNPDRERLEALLKLLRDLYEIIDTPDARGNDKETLKLLELMKDLLESCILSTFLCPQAAEERKAREPYWWVAADACAGNSVSTILIFYYMHVISIVMLGVDLWLLMDRPQAVDFIDPFFYVVTFVLAMFLCVPRFYKEPFDKVGYNIIVLLAYMNNFIAILVWSSFLAVVLIIPGMYVWANLDLGPWAT